jgi:hypothetical protein
LFADERVDSTLLRCDLPLELPKAVQSAVVKRALGGRGRHRAAWLGFVPAVPKTAARGEGLDVRVDSVDID